MKNNANTPTIEEARQAARKLTSKLMADSYKPTGFYPITSVNGEPLYYRIRLDHPDRDKWIRPLSFKDGEWVLEEPNFPNGKPLYNLHEIANRPDETVWIVEGEKCVDALNELGLLATTSGSATSAGAADWSVLSDRNIIVWPDHDQPGNQYIKDAIGGLMDWAQSIQVVDIEPLNLLEHGDCADWLRMHPQASKADVEGLKLLDIEMPKLITDEWDDPQPLQRSLPNPDAFPVDALGEDLGLVAKKISDVIQAPLAICGQSVIAAAALAVQGCTNVVNDGRSSPLSEVFITVGESGERKSAVDSCVLAPHYKYQNKLRLRYDEEFVKYKQQLEIYKKIKEEALRKNGKTRIDLLDALKDIGDEPKPPTQPLIISEEPTYEGLILNLSLGYPSQGLFSDEGGRFIGGHAMNPDNLLKTAAGLCGLWDGKPISRVRKGDGATIISGRRVSLHLMIQPNVAQILLSSGTLQQQGFLSRCLVAFPQTKAGTRLYKEENIWSSAEMKRYEATIMDILESPLPVGEKPNELDPKNIDLEPNAKKLWVKFHNDIEAQLSKDGHLYPIKGLACKAPEHSLRLAGILTIYDSVGISRISRISNISKVSIGLEHMANGIDLTTHYLTEAMRLFNAEFINPDLLQAQTLLDWLKNRGESHISLVDIYQSGPTDVRNANEARKIMYILEEHNWVRQVEDPKILSQFKHKEIWEVRL